MVEVGKKVGQALVKSLPIPQKHPLRNFDPEKLGKIMNDPRFQVDTQDMTPQEYGMFLADLTGKNITNYRQQINDPKSNLREMQNIDLISRLGSEGGLGLRGVGLPGARGFMDIGKALPSEVIVDPSKYAGGYAAANYADTDVSEGISRDLLDAMGKENLRKDFILWSNIADTVDTRHELAHRGFERLINKGFNISDSDEERIIRLLDYVLGDDDNRHQVRIYFKNRNMTIEEA